MSLKLFLLLNGMIEKGIGYAYCECACYLCTISSPWDNLVFPILPLILEPLSICVSLVHSAFCSMTRLQTLSLVLLLTTVSVAALDEWGYSHHSSGDRYEGSRPHRSGDSRAVLLKDVTALTLRRGLKTNGRRVSPVKQLQCLSGCEFQPGVFAYNLSAYVNSMLHACAALWNPGPLPCSSRSDSFFFLLHSDLIVLRGRSVHGRGI